MSALSLTVKEQINLAIAEKEGQECDCKTIAAR
jgi:hypothetical protein